MSKSHDSRPIALASLRLRPPDEADLRWFLSREYEGDLGVRSGFTDFVRQLDLRAKLIRPRTNGDVRFPPRQFLEVSTAIEHGNAEGLADEDILKAAARLRRVRRRWDAVPREHQDVLAALYSGRRYPGLGCFQHAGSGADLSGVVLVAPETRTAHRRSRSTRGLLEWLQRLSERVEKQKQSKKTTSSREQRREDEHLVGTLVLAAELHVTRALRAYEATHKIGREERRAA